MAAPLAFITGSCGLIGSEVSLYFSRLGFRIAGLDNNQRAVFFGPAGDTSWALERLRASIPGYAHHSLDIRDRDAILRLMAELKPAVIIHTAAQPSHDRAAAIPFDDFDVNAVGTLNMLEAARLDNPKRPIRSAVGGFHLNLPRSERMSAPESEIRALAGELGRQVTGPIYTGHCTGAEAFKVMETELGPRLHALQTGMRFEV